MKNAYKANDDDDVSEQRMFKCDKYEVIDTWHHRERDEENE